MRIWYTGGLEADVKNLKNQVQELTTQINNLVDRNIYEDKARKLLAEYEKYGEVGKYYYSRRRPAMIDNTEYPIKAYSLEEFEGIINAAIAAYHKKKCSKSRKKKAEKK